MGDRNRSRIFHLALKDALKSQKDRTKKCSKSKEKEQNTNLVSKNVLPADKNIKIAKDFQKNLKVIDVDKDTFQDQPNKLQSDCKNISNSAEKPNLLDFCDNTTSKKTVCDTFDNYFASSIYDLPLTNEKLSYGKTSTELPISSICDSDYDLPLFSLNNNVHKEHATVNIGANMYSSAILEEKNVNLLNMKGKVHVNCRNSFDDLLPLKNSTNIVSLPDIDPLLDQTYSPNSGLFSSIKEHKLKNLNTEANIEFETLFKCCESLILEEQSKTCTIENDKQAVEKIYTSLEKHLKQERCDDTSKKTILQTSESKTALLEHFGELLSETSQRESWISNLSAGNRLGCFNQLFDEHNSEKDFDQLQASPLFDHFKGFISEVNGNVMKEKISGCSNCLNLNDTSSSLQIDQSECLKSSTLQNCGDFENKEVLSKQCSTNSQNSTSSSISALEAHFDFLNVKSTFDTETLEIKSNCNLDNNNDHLQPPKLNENAHFLRSIAVPMPSLSVKRNLNEKISQKSSAENLSVDNPVSSLIPTEKEREYVISNSSHGDFKTESLVKLISRELNYLQQDRILQSLVQKRSTSLDSGLGLSSVDSLANSLCDVNISSNKSELSALPSMDCLKSSKIKPQDTGVIDSNSSEKLTLSVSESKIVSESNELERLRIENLIDNFIFLKI